MTTAERNQMLWNRAGFGMPLGELRASKKATSKTLDALLDVRKPAPIEVVSAEEWQEANPRVLKAAGIDEKEQRMRVKSFRQKTGELGVLWLQTMITTEHPLREKMALFWHGHFATRAANPYFDQLLLQQFRTNGLGKFSDLLFAVSRSPGMLRFLNNQQNKKSHTNENFAREVMELFTLGRGNYTEQDVKEAARAFTGWTFDEEGAFVVREKQHDNGEKTFLGKTGRFNGDDILNIILEQKQTARFITTRIYRYFVNEESVDARHVEQLSTAFYESGYDIGGLMRMIFSSEWFYAAANRGAHIKSPVELLAGMQRSIPVEFERDRSITMLQRVLGQQLFYPPNVAGWPGGRSWIDASSLVIRMRLADAIYGSKEMELLAKEIDAKMMDVNKEPMAQESRNDGKFRVGKAEVNWSAYIEYWNSFDEEALPAQLAAYLIAVPVSQQQLQTAVKYSARTNKETFIKSLTIRLMSLPEYQLS